VSDNEQRSSPSGMKMTDEAKQQERASLDLNPAAKGVTKIRKELKIGGLAVVTIVLLAIVMGVLRRSGPAPGKGAGAAASGKPVQTAADGGVKGVEELQQEAAMHRAAKAGANAQAADGSGIPNGDVANELALPPTRIAGQGSAQNAQGGPNGAPRQPTKAELRAMEEEALLKSAMTSTLATKGGSQAGSSPAASANPVDSLTRALAERAAAYGQTPATASAGAGGGEEDQNKQDDKAAFLAKGQKRSQDDFQAVSRIQPLSKYEIKAGWDIPATLDQAMNSDLPGDVRGTVRENVYDTASGHYLLIPQGSRVVGTYNSRIAYGQNSVQVVWTRLIYPDGSSIDLGGLNGQDVRGLSGFRDKVDNHYLRLLGFALMTSAFAAGIELSQNQSNNGFTLTPSQAVSQAVGQQVGELGTEITRRNLNIQPTVKISIGYRFTIRVRKDLIFDKPYGTEQAVWK
jgi:type IV secretion system protein TrbI